MDFSKQGSGIYNTIVLVGENGSGKTRIMDSISGFLNCNEVFEFDLFEYDIGEDRYCLKPNPAEYSKFQHDRYKNGEKERTSGKETTMMRSRKMLKTSEIWDVLIQGPGQVSKRTA